VTVVEDSLSLTFAALADPTRRSIVERLAHGALTADRIVLTAEGRLVGMILLGEKKSEVPYGLEDRRLLSALKGVAGLRHSEAAGLRWRHFDLTRQPLGALHLGKTKTDVPRAIPVHPMLRLLLDEWQAVGWERIFGRQPSAEDLIIPTRNMTVRQSPESQEAFLNDLTTLAFRRRRGHDLRRTFITLAQFSTINLPTPASQNPPGFNFVGRSEQLRALAGYGDLTRRGWNAAVGVSYDFTQGAFQNQVAELAYNGSCCGLGFEYRRFSFGTIRNENRFGIVFRVANLGSVGNLRRQEKIF